jgi:hypothetical protein
VNLLAFSELLIVLSSSCFVHQGADSDDEDVVDSDDDEEAEVSLSEREQESVLKAIYKVKGTCFFQISLGCTAPIFGRIIWPFFIPGILYSVGDPDPDLVGSGPFCRIRIQKF